MSMLNIFDRLMKGKNIYLLWHVHTRITRLFILHGYENSYRNNIEQIFGMIRVVIWYSLSSVLSLLRGYCRILLKEKIFVRGGIT